MALRTFRDLRTAFADAYLVKAGRFVVGTYRLQTGCWHWNVNTALPDRAANGWCETREQADAIVREHFAAWLEWAGLQPKAD